MGHWGEGGYKRYLEVFIPSLLEVHLVYFDPEVGTDVYRGYVEDQPLYRR